MNVCVIFLRVNSNTFHNNFHCISGCRIILKTDHGAADRVSMVNEKLFPLDFSK